MKLQGLRRRPSFGRRMTVALGALATGGVLVLAAVTTGVATAGTASGPTGRPHAVEESYTCIPLGVAAYTTRIHVRCAAFSGGNLYYAVPTGDGAHADRVLHVATEAMASGRPVTVWYDPSDTSGAAIGCDPSNCYLLLGIDM